MRFFVPLFIVVLLAIVPLSADAQVATSVTSINSSSAANVPVTTPLLPVVGEPVAAIPATVPTAAASELPALTPSPVPDGPTVSSGESKKSDAPVVPKGEYIQWSRAYVSGVSANIITVVVATKQRRSSYEPVMITSETKVLRGNKPARLADIKIRQYISVRGYRYGDIVKADDFVIGGKLSSDRIARPVGTKRSRNIKPKRAAPVAKKKPAKLKRSR